MADLANLQLTDAEVAKLQADLNGILEHMDKLKEIDTDRRGTNGAGAVRCRRDGHPAGGHPLPPLGNQAALANAPQPGAGYFKVPKIIER